jgi:hypothetical protein
MPKRKTTTDKEEIDARKAVQKFKIDEARNAYPKVAKAFDFNRLGTEQVLDTTRTGDRYAGKNKKTQR